MESLGERPKENNLGGSDARVRITVGNAAQSWCMGQAWASVLLMRAALSSI